VEAEQRLTGRPLTEANAEAAAAAALAGAQTQRDNVYKPELARRTLVRALLQARLLPAAASGA
jgi:xanthine dehydrogenase YagS FAD-binding subunit